MVKSGLIFGAVAFLLVLGSATLITPLCAPCLGLLLGLAAGYVAGVYDKPTSINECIKNGATAGAIAGSLGFLGGVIAGVINGAVVNPSQFNSLFQALGLPNPNYTQTTIWIAQLAGGICLGLFNIVWMAILGLAGGALWFQIGGKDRPRSIVPPQEPIPPTT